MYSSISVINDSGNQNCIERLQVLKVSGLEIFVANFLSQTLISIVQFLPLISILTEYFDCSSSDLLLVFLEVTLGCIFGILLGELKLFLQTFFKALNFPERILRRTINDDILVIELICGLGLITTLLSGICWPAESQPKALQFISNFLPLQAPIESIKLILYKGFNFWHPKVFKGFANLISWILVLTFSVNKF